MVVFAGAKILIFQQITTIYPIVILVNSCFCWCKDTNFSANHNIVVLHNQHTQVVFAGAKILIFQQITTQVNRHKRISRLFLLVQRY